MLHGCNGKMGRMITEIVKGEENAAIAAGVDSYTGVPNDYPLFDSVKNVMWMWMLLLIFRRQKP